MKITDHEFFNLIQKTRNKLYLAKSISTKESPFSIQPSGESSIEVIKITPNKPQSEVQMSTFRFEPDLLDLGEIPAWKSRINFKNDEEYSQKDYYLIGNFDRRDLKDVVISKPPDGNIHVKCNLKNMCYEYDFSPDTDNPIPPDIITGRKKESNQQPIGCRDAQVTNLSSDEAFIGSIHVSDSWLQVFPSDFGIGPQKFTRVEMSVNWEQIKIGRNIASVELKKTDSKEFQKIEVCAWVNVVERMGEKDEFLLDLNEEKKQKIQFTAKEVLKDFQLDINLNNKWDSFPLFEEERFLTRCDEGYQTFLTGDFNEWKFPAYRMQRVGEFFETWVSLSDGAYYYRFITNGEVHLDPIQLSHVYITENGPASIKHIDRVKRSISLHNNSDKSLSAQLKPQSGWLEVSKSELELESGEKEDITLTLIPSHLLIGPNYSSLDIISKEDTYQRLRIPISVNAEVSGLVIKPLKQLYPLKEHKKGKLDTALKFEVIGRGNLQGQILPSYFVTGNNDKLSFTNSDYLKREEVSLPISLRTDSLMKTSEGLIQVLVITNCYISNRRIIPIQCKYSDIIQFQCNPPVIHFPMVFYQDNTISMNCQIRLSNGKPAERLSFNIPESIRDFLWIEPSVNPGEYQVFLDPKKVKKSIFQTIRINDPNAELTGLLRVTVQVANSSCSATIKSSRKSLDGKLSLLINNTGNDPLKLFSIYTENNQFRYEPKLFVEQVIQPRSSLEFYLVPSVKSRKLIKETNIEDDVIIKTSDLENPELKITASMSIPSRFRLFTRDR